MTPASLRRAHRMLPNPISVTVAPQNPTAAPTAGVRAYRGPWTTDERRLFSNEIALEVDRTAFLIPVEAMAIVKTTWKVIDSLGTWTIKSKALELADSMHRCVCIKDA